MYKFCLGAVQTEHLLEVVCGPGGEADSIVLYFFFGSPLAAANGAPNPSGPHTYKICLVFDMSIVEFHITMLVPLSWTHHCF